MTYALVVGGAVSKYPYTLRQMKADYPGVSFPAEPNAGLLAEYKVHEVVVTAAPVPSPAQNVREITPTLVNGKWTQTWELVAASAEEIAARQMEAADGVDKTSVMGDGFIPQFLAMTPAQLDTYIDNNTANLAAMRTLVKKMARMLLILARRELR